MRKAAIAALALALGGCGLFGGGSESGDAGPAVPRGERSALDGEADQLLAADRAFAQRSAERGALEAHRAFYDEKGLRIAASGEPLQGLEAIREQLSASPARVLTWQPRYAEVFAPGKWGWTWGEWQAHEPGAGGRRLAQGRYMNLWKKQPDGSWKVRSDLSSAEALP
ncbi:MAG TPA: nuclear transport factor 2 family protein [Verrucomicrobiae bacterium]|nr:nuclear transport factor 2 family protein [Verrucomicrobiae bacterium]